MKLPTCVSGSQCYRKKGKRIDLLQRQQVWSELHDVADKVELSSSLQSYFLSENVGLAKEDCRQILLAKQSSAPSKASRSRSGSASRTCSTESAGRAWWRSARASLKSLLEKVLAERAMPTRPRISRTKAMTLRTEMLRKMATKSTSPTPWLPSMLRRLKRVIIRHRDDDIYDAFASYPDNQKKLPELQKFRGFTSAGRAARVPARAARGVRRRGPGVGMARAKRSLL